MVSFEPSSERPCTQILKALADETRWRIVNELLGEPLTVGEVADRLQISHYNTSKHLRILRESGILATVKTGRHVYNRIDAKFSESLTTNQSCGHELDLGCCQFQFPRSESSPTLNANNAG